MSVTKFVLVKDINSNVTYGVPTSNTIYAAALTANTPQSLTVPANAQLALYSWTPGVDLFVNPTTTAAVPGASFAAATTEQNPTIRPVIGGSTLSFVSPSNCNVTVSFYEVKNKSTGLS